MGPSAPAPATTPTNANANMPYGSNQNATDQQLSSNILSFLPTQEQQSAQTNPGNSSMIPTINFTPTVYTAPSAPTINPGSFSQDAAGQLAYANAVQKAEQQMQAQEAQTLGAAQGQLSSFASKYGNLAPIEQNLESQFQVPGYQQDVVTLQGLLQNLNQDVNQQTTLGGGLMGESARDELYAERQQPLSMSLSNAENELQTAQTNVNTLLDTYEKSYGNIYEPMAAAVGQLPTEFEQANNLATSGYGQGGQTLQDVISNAIQREQAAAYEKMVQGEYGSGGSGGVGSVMGGLAAGTLPGISGKAGAYGFTVNGKPASAATWAINNASQFGQGTQPAQAVLNMIYSMAAQGDKTANQAYSEIEGNGGNITPSIMNKYGSLFWGSPGFGVSTPAPKATSQPQKKSNGGGGLFNMFDIFA